ISALLRFLRLFGDGGRARAADQRRDSDQFQLALQIHLDHRVLAALAYLAVEFPAGLSLHSARRQPPGTGPALREFADDHGTRRALAWRRLDVSRVGNTARRRAGAQSSVAEHRA